MRITVVGSGVSGLSCGVAMLQAGLGPVELWTRALPPQTTSAVAAAIWYPYRVEPPGRVLGWARRSYGVFALLAQDPETGVRMREGLELFREPAADPWWRDAAPDFRRARPDELPAGFQDGYAFAAPVIEMPVYLDWLTRRFEALGGRIRLRELASLGEALAEADVAVNCSGLGSRELAGDNSLYPVRGQVLRVVQPGVERWLVDDHGPGGITYVVPRSRDCVLGGTAEEHREDLEPDAAAAEAIRLRCAALDPRLATARALSDGVGLRPCRPSVRLEAEAPAAGKLLVHNYGHGGAGVTLSWGCAAEVLELVRNTRL